MRHFWNWVRNDDESRTLYLDGMISRPPCSRRSSSLETAPSPFI